MTSSPNTAQLLTQHAQLLAALSMLRAQIAALGDVTAVPGELVAREAGLVAALAGIEAALRASGQTTQITTGGGDVAGRDIDSRRGNFISGGSFYGDVIGEQTFVLPAQTQAPHQPWVMPHGQNPLFLGRAEELERLEALLTSDEPENRAILPALTGVGGMGKTQLAIEFAHRFRAQFPGGVFWLSMERPATVATQVATCGGPTGLCLFDNDPSERRLGSRGHDTPQEERLTLKQRVDLVRMAWEQPTQRLLIFDNLEDPSLLAKWRPHGGGSRVLITTRSERWASYSGVQVIPLRPLMDPESLALLLRPRAQAQNRSVAALLVEPGAQAAANTLVQVLGGLPLALTLAGHYLAERSLAVTDYLHLIQAASVQHASLNASLHQDLPTGHAASIVATFALSTARLRPDEPTDQQAYAIWLGAAQLAPEPIPVDLLLQLVGLNLTDPVQREQGDLSLLRLREVGLLEQVREGLVDCYRLHRLLAAYARCISDDLVRDRSRAETAIVAAIQRLDDVDRLFEAPRWYGAHLQHLTATLAGRTDLTAAALWHEQGRLWWTQEEYDRAWSSYRRALDLRRQVLSALPPDTADTLHELSVLACDEGRLDQARGYGEEALRIRLHIFGPLHRATASTKHALGNIALAEEAMAQARTYYTEALAVKEQTLGRRRATAATVHALGRLAYATGNYDQAREYYADALEQLEQTVGRTHRSTAKTLHGLGDVAYQQRDYAQARGYYTEALAIKMQHHGREHRSTVYTMEALGCVAQAEGDFQAAEAWFRTALAIEEQILGPDHCDTMQTRRMWEAVAREIDRMKRSEEEP
jgi:tetratricopeptide (TPR) repeat protein